MKRRVVPRSVLDRFADRPWLQTLVKVSIAIPLTIASPFLQLWAALKAIARDPQTQGLILATIALLFAGSVIFHWLEDWSYVDSLYFSFITLATIGFGDFVPTTNLTKILTIIYALAGLGIIFGFFDAIAAQRMKQGGVVERLKGRRSGAARDSPPAQP